jgi:hypothetical protein
VVLSHDFDMEQRAVIKFYFKLGKSISETYLLQKAYGSDSLSRSMTCEWFKRFREGRDSLEDDDGKIRFENNVHRLLRCLRRDSP